MPNHAVRGMCLSVLLGAGCAPIVGPVDVEAAVPQSLLAADYRLETVRLETVTELGAGRGTHFDIVGYFNITNDFLQANIDFDDKDAQSSMKRESRAYGSSGPLAPRLRYNPVADRYEAEDFDTLVYLSAFHAFENIWRYYEDTIGDGTRATREKTIVSLYGGAVASAQVPITITATHDNAEYLPTGDVFAIKRVEEQEGIPLAVNWAVLAHEFFHRVFFHHVQSEGGALKYVIDVIWPGEVAGGRSPGDNDNPRAYQVYRGVNEGLADIFAIGMTGRTSIFVGSDQDPTFHLHSRYRDLTGDFADELTYEALTNAIEDDTGRKKCGKLPVDDEDESFINVYCLGTLVARVIYDTADKDFELLQSRVLPQVLKVLRPLGEDIAVRSEEDEGRLSFEVPMLFNRVFDGLDPDLREGFCDSLRGRFSSVYSDIVGCAALLPLP